MPFTPVAAPVATPIGLDAALLNALNLTAWVYYGLVVLNYLVSAVLTTLVFVLDAENDPRFYV